VNENLTALVRELKPIRWKVFQCLLLTGENVGAEAKRNAKSFVVSDGDFQRFLERHADLSPIAESNADMRDSYLILDERMRFLDCTQGGKTPSQSILDVGVASAISRSGHDEAAFIRRKGIYAWSKEPRDNLDW